MPDLTQLIGHWGYSAIFFIVILGSIGIPVPEEAIMFLAGLLVWEKKLELSVVLIVGFLSTVIGDNLGYWLIGSRHIVNKIRPINKPTDCQGLKVRVINSQVYIQTFRALGASTVSLDPSELYVALQQGVVDGFEYPLPDLVSIKLYEVSKYISLDAHTIEGSFSTAPLVAGPKVTNGTWKVTRVKRL